MDFFDNLKKRDFEEKIKKLEAIIAKQQKIIDKMVENQESSYNKKNYEELIKSFGVEIYNVLDSRKKYNEKFEKLVNNKEYLDYCEKTKICDKCDIEKYDFDINKCTKEYCPFAPICALDLNINFDLNSSLRIIREELH